MPKNHQEKHKHSSKNKTRIGWRGREMNSAIKIFGEVKISRSRCTKDPSCSFMPAYQYENISDISTISTRQKLNTK